MKRSSSPGAALMLAAMLSGTLGLTTQAQSRVDRLPPPPGSGKTVAESLPQRAQNPAPSLQAGQRPDGSIHGTVVDPNGGVIAGARVTLEIEAADARQTVLSGENGFFNFGDLQPGPYRVRISSNGFADWIAPAIDLPAGGSYEVPHVALRIAQAQSEVDVVFTRHDLAEEQIKAQEQQRILGVFPNFYASYVWHAVPLTPGQKLKLALRTTVDPVTFASDGITAAIEQSQNYLSGYGSGGEGYAKRFGAAYADDVVATFIGSAALPSLLHQDPRFFYKGTGSIASRALYAISTVVICKGDNGRWQPNYSNVLGNLAAAGIANLYYPEKNRDDAGVTVDNALIGTAEGAIGALLQEFVLRKISRGVQRGPSNQP